MSDKKPLPIIGIRPIIDGRQGGIRESLEYKTMNMAINAKELITNSLKYSNDKPIEVIIADSTIGGIAENIECEEKFNRLGVEITLSVTPCWCYGTETMDMNPNTIKAIWGFNGTERPGAVYLAAALAAHNQKGLPAFSIYGHNVQDLEDDSIPLDVSEKILLFCKSAIAAKTMNKKSYLSIGSVSMGIAGSIPNHDFFQDFLGMKSEQIDTIEILRRIEKNIFDKEEFDKALNWSKQNCRIGFDNNANDKKYNQIDSEKQFEFCIKMMIIFRDLMYGNKKLNDLGYIEESKGHGAICAGFQGQRQWTDFLPNGDFAEAMLNSSFDWNGIREPIPFATENDTLNGATMLIGHLLTDKAQLFADVRTYWSNEAVLRVAGKPLEGIAENGIIHLINSGAASLDATGECRDENNNPIMKSFWDISEKDMKNCLESTEWCPANVDYFRGGGFSSRFKNGTEGGLPMTMARINLIKGIGPVLQLAEGYTVKLPSDIHKILEKRTDPTWPTTWFAPILTNKGAFKDVYTVMSKWGANHAALSYGHIGHLLITLASMLRIPVSMHNVDSSRIFRPTFWDSMGTENIEDADYRACKILGSLYGFKN